jgi:hypothetical protein
VLEFSGTETFWRGDRFYFLLVLFDQALRILPGTLFRRFSIFTGGLPSAGSHKIAGRRANMAKIIALYLEHCFR